MSKSLPELSRFELQCLRRLWNKGEASVREIQAEFSTGPSYSTFRKIIERLEDKGAVVRVRQEGRAWIYRSAVSPSGMIRKEIRRLIDGLFDGKGAPLVAHLADMEALSLEDLREIEETLAAEDTAKGAESKPSAPPAPRKRRR
jgi:BlaI family penicillinase repressor